jgi:phytanoyl-CoA hydroxylase
LAKSKGWGHRIFVVPLPTNPFASALWIDQPDAADKIARLRVSDEERAMLEHFHREGYLRLFLDPATEPLDALLADVDRLWREKPDDVLYGFGGPFLRRMSNANEATERRAGSRIQEMQSHSTAARRLYLHPRLHRIARLILGEQPVAIQSIFFQYGSAQALHRDPVFVQTAEAGHLIAAWIALEDIDPRSGPLVYIPRSHRLPPYEYKPGVYRFDSRILGDEHLAAEQEWLRHQMQTRGLKREVFTPKKGEVLFWHAGLYHGGEAITDLERTRKSFVVHYSSRRTHHVAACTFADQGDTLRIVGTHRLLQDGNAVGFDNPLSRRGAQLWPTLRNRVAALLHRR